MGPTETRSILGSIVGALPGVAVLGLLACVGVWGHRTGWKAPKVSELGGASTPVETEDWCAAHNVPKSRCLACNPELGGANPQDWCREHGMPESKCTLCHPEILTKGQADDWCKEHGVPESQCTLCHPDLAVKGKAPPSETGATVAADPAAKPAKDPAACQTHLLRVQFASPEAVRKAGVKLEAVQERPFAVQVEALGEVEYDQTRLARLSSRAPGTVCRVYKEVGDAVVRGEVLALVDAAEAGRAKADFLQALTAAEVKEKLLPRLSAAAKESAGLTEIKASFFERLRPLVREHLQTVNDLQTAEAELAGARLQALKSQTELQEGEAAVREARIRLFNAHQALLNLGLPVRIEDLAGLSDERIVERLRFLGLPETATKGLDPNAATANLIPVTAPLDGVVISRDVVAGEVVDLVRTLYVVADVRRMWVMLDVQPEDAGRLAVGQAVLFHPLGGSEAVARGQLEWIGTAVDKKTRTVRARVAAPNTDGMLRAHTFGRARVTTRNMPKAVAVPSEAIHWEGCCYVVFVRLTDDIFQTRKIKPGARNGPYTEVLVGVLPGEVVATTGSHVLKSEILKSALGAGCCD